MGNISIEQEQALRAEIAAELATIALCGNVFDRRRAFNSRKDFFDRLASSIGTGSTKTKEIRFTEIELINLEDSDEGFDDCPVPVLTYGLHCFHEFADSRTSNDSNSDRDFTELLLTLRSHFNNKRYFADRKAVTDPGIMATGGEFTQFGGDTFTDVVGHSKDLTLKVFYYDEAQA